MNRQIDRQTRLKVSPSPQTTYADGKNYFVSCPEIIVFFDEMLFCKNLPLSIDVKIMPIFLLQINILVETQNVNMKQVENLLSNPTFYIVYLHMNVI